MEYDLSKMNKFDLALLQARARAELAHRGVADINRLCIQKEDEGTLDKKSEMLLNRLNNEVRKPYPNYQLVEELTELLLAFVLD